MRVVAGPLVDFSPDGLPDYVRRLGGDPITLKSLMCDYVETVVNRYRGKVSQWSVTTGACGSCGVGLSEEDLIRLTAMAADAAWQIDSGLQLSFGISQPWGDYLARGGHEYSPFVYADTLLRAGLPFAGIDLEWHFGTAPRGSYCRDTLEASRLLDLFGLLGVPVKISMSYPSSTGPAELFGLRHRRRAMAGIYAGSPGRLGGRFRVRSPCASHLFPAWSGKVFPTPTRADFRIPV